MNEIIDISNTNFDTVLEENKKLLVLAHAPWAEPSKKTLETVQSLAQQDKVNFSVGVTDVEADWEIAARLAVSAVPCLYVFVDGVLKTLRAGQTSDEEILDLLKSVN